jgi:LPS-assembly protein
MSGYMISSRKRCALLLLGGAVLSARPVAADPLCVPAPARLRLAAAPLPLPDTVHIDLSRAATILDGKSPTTACGDARISWEERSINGDCFSYDPLNNSLHVIGHFRYQDPTIRLEADNGSYDDSGAAATGARFQLLQQPGRGAAESVNQNSKGEVELRRVSYTTCAGDRPDWQLIASRITLNLDNERGVGHGARVEFKGIPVLYVPWISFPLSSRRQSGFLYPTFGTSSLNGVTLSLPYYLNLAPNHDLTLTPTIYTKRGMQLGSEFRFLQPAGHGTVQLDFMPHDMVRNTQRNYEHIKTEWQLRGDWRVRVDAENAGDTHYFEDFAQGPLISSTAFLARLAELSFRNDSWQLAAQLQQFQILDSQMDRNARPYTWLPRLYARGHRELSPGWRMTLDSEAAGFDRDTGVRGWRAVATPTLSWERVRPGYFIRPSVGWDFTAYRLQRQAVNLGSSPTRSVPMFNLDFGLQLEKQLRESRRLTLEPRLLYTYIPFRDQSRLPVFDTGVPDPNFVSLYRSNRYVGGDLVGDANKLAIGVTSRMVDAATGVQYLSATLGQSYEFSAPRTRLPGETPSSSRHSDFIGNVELRAYRNYSLRADLAWNPQLSAADRSQLSVQYRRANNQVINVGYRFDRGSVEQGDVSAAWPIARRWEAYARAVYSLRNHQAIDNFAGIRYRASCWGLRAVMRRSLSSRTGVKDTGIYLQFELNGLSSVGTGADTFLQESIQGYSAADSRQ